MLQRLSKELRFLSRPKVIAERRRDDSAMLLKSARVVANERLCGGRADDVLVNLNGHEAGNGGNSQGTPTARRAFLYWETAENRAAFRRDWGFGEGQGGRSVSFWL
jgi:hypothetical protein